MVPVATGRKRNVNTMTEQTQCRWRRDTYLTWVVHGPIDVIVEGATVTVAKKDGSEDEVEIAFLGSPMKGPGGADWVLGYPVPMRRDHLPLGTGL